MTEFTWGPMIGDSGTRFRLWAPAAGQVMLEFADAEPQALELAENGWWTTTCPAPPGTQYRFRIGGVSVPDPAARRQINDVHGWSVVEQDTYAWRIRDWKPRPWEDAVFCEVHAGLMGGFRGLVDHLEYFQDVGVTAIELMPVNDFPGQRNWGYDGVLPYAPDEAYGTPDDLKGLVDEAHARGLMVFLDVVYNHFGPDGNYLPLYAPQFFRNDRKTPWGDAIDFRQQPVRRFFIENALYWLREFRLDGLRFDAVHAIRDAEFMNALGREVLGEMPDRHLVLENEDNDAPLLDTFRAQWNDDFHNVMHVLLTSERAGYYADFVEKPAAKLARCLAEGFVYQGDYAPHAERNRGYPSRHLPPTSFVSFLQNHDQTGNRAFGERLTALANPKALKAAAVLQILCPQIPMLFMGEERGAREPFLFFTDHQDPKLAKAVREGRAAEFAKFPEFASGNATVPDPNALDTFERCRTGAGDPEWRALYKRLLTLRREMIVPRLRNTRAISGEAIGEKAVVASWKMGDGAILTIATNLSHEGVNAASPSSAPFFGETSEGTIPPFSTVAWMEAP